MLRDYCIVNTTRQLLAPWPDKSIILLILFNSNGSISGTINFYGPVLHFSGFYDPNSKSFQVNVRTNSRQYCMNKKNRFFSLLHDFIFKEKGKPCSNGRRSNKACSMRFFSTNIFFLFYFYREMSLILTVAIRYCWLSW